jgi:hypothetical protein
MFGKSEAEALDLIEDYIDALPHWTFSDRLISGDRAEFSRVVRNTVRQAYHGNAGQSDPSTSTRKLQATAEAWKRKGFDLTDKSTWTRPTATGTITLAPDFTWTPSELQQLAQMQPILRTGLEIAASAVRHVLRLVEGHQGEIGVGLVKQGHAAQVPARAGRWGHGLALTPQHPHRKRTYVLRPTATLAPALGSWRPLIRMTSRKSPC